MAYTLRQAFERAYNRINIIEDITLDREYSIINSYSVIREALDDEQRSAMLQLIENGIGYAHLSDQEVEALENLIFGSPAQEAGAEAPAWVFKYLSKPGKSLDTLEKAVMRMTKAEILDKFDDLGWGLTIIHSKKEMVSIILTELQNMGYAHEDAAQARKARKKKAADRNTVMAGLEYSRILESDLTDAEVLKALGFEAGMDVMAWWGPVAKAVSTARLECGLDMYAGVRLDSLYGVALAA